MSNEPAGMTTGTAGEQEDVAVSAASQNPPQGVRETFVWNEPGRYGAFKLPFNGWRRYELEATLYFVGDGGPLIKVGIARDLKKRMRTLALGNPRITVLASRTMPASLDRQVEKMVHAALAPHAAGREWFSATLDVALASAKPILERAGRAYHKMIVDGYFADAEKDRLWPSWDNRPA
jgi:hypothetical protein